jgi:hypothetical protein
MYASNIAFTSSSARSLISFEPLAFSASIKLITDNSLVAGIKEAINLIARAYWSMN